MTQQAWTIAGGILGGGAGYYFGKKNPLWMAVGALAGAVLLPPTAAAAMPALPSGPSVKVWTEQLVPGKTIILRASVGDIVNVLAPSGWGIPSATANMPGFLQIQATTSGGEATTLKIVEAGQGQIQMANGGEVAVLSIEAT
jgi:hypothetical protein